MQKLKKFIEQKTLSNTKEVQESVLEMVCLSEDPVALSSEKICNALEREGEFLVLKVHYNDFVDELEKEVIKYKISQSLSIVVSYEDDGNSYENIEKFIKYMYDKSDEKQNFIFGIKKVEKLSQYPITILFSGILPINQLKMNIGKKIRESIDADNVYFKSRFTKFRDSVSQEIGIPILPLFPKQDETLDDYEVCLVDTLDGRVISQFGVEGDLNRDTIEVYLLKLFYIYKVLAQEKKCKALS
jgi:hypothetical protein